MPTPSEHWLWRLTAPQWMDAATVETIASQEHISKRRKSLSHARRGAGMAVNALLVQLNQQGYSPEFCEGVLGRSYVEHLRLLSQKVDPKTIEDEGPQHLNEHFKELLNQLQLPASKLMAISLTQGPLISLQVGPPQASKDGLHYAESIVRLCRSWIEDKTILE